MHAAHTCLHINRASRICSCSIWCVRGEGARGSLHGVDATPPLRSQ